MKTEIQLDKTKQRLLALMIVGAVFGLGTQTTGHAATVTAPSTPPKAAVTPPVTTSGPSSSLPVTTGATATTSASAVVGQPVTSAVLPVSEATTGTGRTGDAPVGNSMPAAANSTAIPVGPTTPNTVTTAPATAPAPAEIIDTGTFGTAPWTLDSANHMTITAGAFGPSALGRFSHGSVTHVAITGKVTLNPDSSELFSGWKALTGISGLENLDTSHVTNMNGMFSNNGLTSLDFSKTGWQTGQVTTMSDLFSNDPHLTTVNVTGFDTSHVTTLRNLFANDPQLATVTGIGDWQTGQVTDMSSLFNNTALSLPSFQVAHNHALQTVDLAKWDTSHVTTLNSLFAGDQALETVDLSRWDTGNVSNFAQVFQDDSALKTLDVSQWNVAKMTTMTAMFQNDQALAALDVGRWAPSAVASVNLAFAGDGQLRKLDLSKIAMQPTTLTTNLLAGTTSLAELKLGPYSRLAGTGLLEAPQNATYQGKWEAVASQKQYTAANLMSNYDGATMADTYVWATYLGDPGHTGETPTTPGDTGTSTAPGGSGETSTTPGDTGTSTVPGGSGETPTTPGGSGTSTVPGGPGETPTGPSHPGSIPPEPANPGSKPPVATAPSTSGNGDQPLVSGPAVTVLGSSVGNNPTVSGTSNQSDVNLSTVAPLTHGTLPQTDEQSSPWLSWLGVLGMIFLSLRWFKKRE